MAMTTRTAATVLGEIETLPVDRDRLLREVLMEIPAGDRVRFMEICIEKIPEHVAFIDGVILLSGYVQSEIIDVHDIDVEFRPRGEDEDGDDVGCCIDCQVDENGRIVELEADPDWRITLFGRDDFRKDMFNPLLVAFSRLEKLRDLSILCPLQCLPLELSNFLVNLEDLTLCSCSNLVNDNFPLQLQQLPSLKELSLIRNQLKPSSSFFTWLAGPRSLPNLETLAFYLTESGNTKAAKAEADCILDFLCNLDDDTCCFRNSLRTIKLFDGYSEFEVDTLMEEDAFKKLMTRVLPKFPNLTMIAIPRHGVESFQPIVNRIHNGSNYISATIRELVFHGTQTMKTMKTDPKEMAALLSFLRIFNTITTIDFQGLKVDRCDDEVDYAPDIKFALQANHAGRRIVQVGGYKGRGGSESYGDHRSSFPVSLWPTVLERAYEKSDHIYPRESKYRGTKDATGLFYLLREVGSSLLSGTNKKPYQITSYSRGRGPQMVTIYPSDLAVEVAASSEREHYYYHH